MSTVATIWARLNLDSSGYQEGIEKAARTTDDTARAIEADFKKIAEAVDITALAVEKLGETTLTLDDLQEAAKQIQGETQGMEEGFADLNKFIESGAKNWLEYLVAMGRVSEVTALYRGQTKFLKKDLKELNEAQEEANKQTEESAKSSDTASKQLKKFAKGLIGVATAYAGGRWLIGLAKDSIKAAVAAGKASKEFLGLEKSTKKLSIAVGVGLTAALGKAFKPLGDLAGGFGEAVIGGLDGVDQAIVSQIRSMTAAGATSAELNAEYERLAGVTGRTTEEMKEMVRTQGALNTSNSALILGAQFLTDSWQEFNTALEESEIRRIEVPLRLAAEQAEAFALAMDNLRATFFPLTELTEEFRQSIEDLTLEGEDLVLQFGLLEFLTPEQQEEISTLKSELTGVWIAYNDVITLIEDEDLGTKQLEDAETQAADLRLEMGRLETEIRILGGLPYVTEEQETEARERLNEIEGNIKDIETAWEEQTKTMIFNMVAQGIAMSGLPWEEQIQFMNDLAGPQGLGLVDQATVDFNNNILEIIGLIDTDTEAALEAFKLLAAEMAAADGTVIETTWIQTIITVGEPGAGGSGGGQNQEPTTEGEPGTGGRPGPGGSGKSDAPPTGDAPPGFTGDVNVTITATDPMTVGDELIDLFGGF